MLGADNIADKIYKNRNGNIEINDFVKLIHTKEIDSWARGHRLNLHPCPPIKLLRGKSVNCTYCSKCISECAGKVKEYKSHYQIGNIKILKEELDDKS